MGNLDKAKKKADRAKRAKDRADQKKRAIAMFECGCPVTDAWGQLCYDFKKTVSRTTVNNWRKAFDAEQGAKAGLEPEQGGEDAGQGTQQHNTAEETPDAIQEGELANIKMDRNALCFDDNDQGMFLCGNEAHNGFLHTSKTELPNNWVFTIMRSREYVNKIKINENDEMLEIPNIVTEVLVDTGSEIIPALANWIAENRKAPLTHIEAIRETQDLRWAQTPRMHEEKQRRVAIRAVTDATPELRTWSRMKRQGRDVSVATARTEQIARVLDWLMNHEGADELKIVRAAYDARMLEIDEMEAENNDVLG